MSELVGVQVQLDLYLSGITGCGSVAVHARRKYASGGMNNRSDVFPISGVTVAGGADTNNNVLSAGRIEVRCLQSQHQE